MSKGLPRKVIYKLNFYENGWLQAAMFPYMDRMKEEQPVMYLQFQISFCKAYAEADGHPLQEKSKKDMERYQEKLDELLAKENE